MVIALLVALGPVGHAQSPGECDDGIDNDGDGLVDWQNDPDCGGPADQESPHGLCDDFIDNDGDGQTDWPDDVDCQGPADEESPHGACDDFIDNDGDGLVDWPADPDCEGPAGDESPQGACADGVDNDGDGLVDWPADPDCEGPGDDSEMGPPATPQDVRAYPGLGLHRITLQWTAVDLGAGPSSSPGDGGGGGPGGPSCCAGYVVRTSGGGVFFVDETNNESPHDGEVWWHEDLPSPGGVDPYVDLGPQSRTYNVTAVNAAGESAPSADVSMTSPAACFENACVVIHPLTHFGFLVPIPLAMAGEDDPAAARAREFMVRLETDVEYAEQRIVALQGEAVPDPMALDGTEVGGLRVHVTPSWFVGPGLRLTTDPEEFSGAGAEVVTGRLQVYTEFNLVTDVPVLLAKPVVCPQGTGAGCGVPLPAVPIGVALLGVALVVFAIRRGPKQAA